MSGFTDIHAHFVYGIDDGAQTRGDMEGMLDAAVRDGVTALYATAHVTPGLKPFDARVYRSRLDEARRYCRGKGYPIRLYEGAEILYTPVIERYAAEERLPTLADTRTLLLEFVPNASMDEVERAVELMDRHGYTTIIAHIERCDCMYLGGAYRLKDRHDVLYQVNCSPVIEGRGLLRTHAIQRWFRDQLIDFVASDAHGVRHRQTRMREAYGALMAKYGEEYASRLMRGDIRDR